MIYFKLNDNFGNWLFRCGAALATGCPVRGLVTGKGQRETYAYWEKVFPGLELVDRLPEGTRQFVEPHFTYDPLPEYLQKGDWLLIGYYQSWKYFDDAQMRQRLVLPESYEAELRRLYGDWLARPGVATIGVRRGDYLRLPEYHPFVGERYFREAIGRLPETKDFIVCSNDHAWCRDFFLRNFPDRNFLFPQGEAWQDLFLPSLCPNNVISNSTFNWWGAWLNRLPNHRVIAPSNWFGLGCRRQGQTPRDLYLEGTEVVVNHQAPTDYLRGLAHLARNKFREAIGKGNPHWKPQHTGDLT